MSRIALFCLAVFAAGTFATASDEIRVGVIAPLSGSLTPYGKGCLDGMKIRVAEANRAGGVGGKKVILVIEDNKGEKTESKNAYIKLCGTDRVVAVMGPVTSTNTLALRRVAKKFEIPVISPTATNDKVTLKNDWMFRSCFKDSFQGRVVARYCLQDRDFKKAAVFIDENSDYSKGLADSFSEAFAAGGGTVAATESYRQKDTEFGAQLNRIKKSGAQVLFVPGYPPEVPLIIKQARVVGYGGAICGADGWDNDPVLNGSGDAISECFITGMFSPEDKRPIVQKFIAACEEELGSRPGTFEAQGYDTAALVIEALKAGTSAAAVQKGLFAIKDLNAVTGSITITPEGDAQKSAVILRIEKNAEGKFVTRYVTTKSP